MSRGGDAGLKKFRETSEYPNFCGSMYEVGHVTDIHFAVNATAAQGEPSPCPLGVQGDNSRGRLRPISGSP